MNGNDEQKRLVEEAQGFFRISPDLFIEKLALF